jgi:hypothetical protein
MTVRTLSHCKHEVIESPEVTISDLQLGMIQAVCNRVDSVHKPIQQPDLIAVVRESRQQARAEISGTADEENDGPRGTLDVARKHSVHLQATSPPAKYDKRYPWYDETRSFSQN